MFKGLLLQQIKATFLGGESLALNFHLALLWSFPIIVTLFQFAECHML